MKTTCKVTAFFVAAIVALCMVFSTSVALADNSSSSDSSEGGLTVKDQPSNDDVTISRSNPSGKKPANIKDGTWTILVYMCGSNLESEQGSATRDLQEMLSTHNGDTVHYVIATGGAKKWYVDGIDASQIQYFEVKNDSLKKLKDCGKKNMGDPETLANFVKWGIQEYPSDNIGLILWDHGGGPLGGVCYDENYNYDPLDLVELDAALKDASSSMWEKFEFIGFDACQMANFEVANYLASYANYLIGSEENEPGSGWNYSGTSEYLSKNGDATGRSLGEYLVTEYYNSLEGASEEEFASQANSTLAVIDLSKMDELNKALNSFSKDLVKLADSNQYREYVKGIDSNYECGQDANLLDLKVLANTYKNLDPKDMSEARIGRVKVLLDAIDNAIPKAKGGVQKSEACGLSIYYPMIADQAKESIDAYGALCKTPQYLEFVKKVSNVSSTTEAQNTIQYAEEPHLTDDGMLSFTLAEESEKNVKSVTGLVLQQLDVKDESTGKTQTTILVLGQTYDVVREQNTPTYYDNFDGKWFTLPNGSTLAAQAWGEDTDNNVRYYLTSISLKKKGKKDFENVMLAFAEYADTNKIVVGKYTPGETIDDANAGSFEGNVLEPGDVVVARYAGLQAGENGEWEDYVGPECTVDNNFKISYGQLSDCRYYYGFIITDVYGQECATDLAQFIVDENGKVTYEKDLLEID